MYRGGRQKKPIWAHYKEVQVDGKALFECIYSKSQQLPKDCRMQTHYEKCSSRLSTAPTSNKHPLVNIEVGEQPPSKKQIRQGDLDSHVLLTSDNMKNNIDQILAKFFFACNIPFTAVEHPAFLALVESLHPGYTPPTRMVLA